MVILNVDIVHVQVCRCAYVCIFVTALPSVPGISHIPMQTLEGGEKEHLGISVFSVISMDTETV